MSNVMAGYDRWLERPYQQAAARGEEEDAAEEMIRDEELECPHCGKVRRPAHVRIDSVQTWSNGGYAGGSIRYAWSCDACAEQHDDTWEWDNCY